MFFGLTFQDCSNIAIGTGILSNEMVKLVYCELDGPTVARTSNEE